MTPTGELGPVAAELRAAFVAAYPDYVRSRVADRGLAGGANLDEAIQAGQEWLATELTTVLSGAFAAQRRSPLEVFQEAMRFPGEALATAGMSASARAPAVAAALPGDRYDLAPASSQDLGEEAWRAHLAWGAAKAGALAGPAVLYCGANLMDRSAIEGAGAASGLRFATATDVTAARRALAGTVLVAFVDLVLDTADELIAAVAEAGVQVIAFGPHVDDWALDRARSLGATQALPRSVFFRRVGELIPERL